MIVEKLLDIFFGFINTIFSYLPVMQFDIDTSVLEGLYDILSLCLYFFPWAQVSPILAIIVVLQVWRIVITLIRTLWDLLPLA